MPGPAALAVANPNRWTVRGEEINLDRPLVLGILNVTPDSFSDGGEYMDSAAAVERAVRMMESGADFVDVGGESTRPGAMPVDADEEWSRVGPVVEALAARGVPVSVDTTKAGVAERSADAGAVAKEGRPRQPRCENQKSI